MNNQLLGVPYTVWGVLCLILAAVWAFAYPRNRVTPEYGLRFIILRWFHALAWLLLALGAFLASIGSDAGSSIAFLALPVYLLFMLTFVTSKPRA